MSSFNCEHCGRPQIDQDQVGYVEGCSHYPPEHSKFVTVYYGGDTTPDRAFYKGAWYKSEQSRAHGKAVHPIAWSSIRCVHGQIKTECATCSAS